MVLSKDDIDYIAHLARLEISTDEVADYSAKLGKIIDFINELDKADTGDLLPMAHPLDMSQRLRPDEVTETDQRDTYQQNATEKSAGLYVVPRVVE
ncbi:MAG: Asp-tRNA(Asn)/Glu-tRNA(Gln) amidotransferase subunit GatC [Gammaproteobacteria bacterium]|nr:Asp-tRNA(Asn)/Glu-tRNA(Gln) amidotransferase subunit GatC [Gammaproteobacteria bacterium]